MSLKYKILINEVCSKTQAILNLHEQRYKGNIVFTVFFPIIDSCCQNVFLFLWCDEIAALRTVSGQESPDKAPGQSYTTRHIEHSLNMKALNRQTANSLLFPPTQQRQ